jgi:5-aminopentanamidase
LAICATSSAGVGVACAQLAPEFGDLAGNRARAAKAIRAAARVGARLIVLPELCTTGYAFADRDEALALGEPADGPSVRGWRAMACELGVTVIAGFCERDRNGEPRNSAALLDADGSCVIYRKTHLWDREQEIFVAGEAPPPVAETSAGRIGIAICYDAFFPEVMRTLALAGAELIAVPMNSPVATPAPAPGTTPASEIVLALAAATVNRVFVAQADRSGPERGIVWAQASAICDPDGLLVAGPVSGPGLLHASCDLRRARDKALGARNDVLADRRPELYSRPDLSGGPAQGAGSRSVTPTKEMVK